MTHPNVVKYYKTFLEGEDNYFTSVPFASGEKFNKKNSKLILAVDLRRQAVHRDGADRRSPAG